MIQSLLSDIGGAIAGVFNWLTNRSALNNSPEIQANVTAKIDQQEHEKNEQAVSSGDLDAIRKRGAD